MFSVCLFFLFIFLLLLRNRSARGPRSKVGGRTTLTWKNFLPNFRRGILDFPNWPHVEQCPNFLVLNKSDCYGC